MSPRRQWDSPVPNDTFLTVGASYLVPPHFKATVEAEVFPRLTDRRLEIYESL